MSKIKVNRLENTSTANGGIDIDTSGHVQVDGLQMPTAGPLSNRNKIINGDMRIDQRNAGASVTSAGPTYTVDRWSWYYTSGSGHTIQQNTDAPTGFSYSLKVTIGTGASPSANHQNILWQPIEGYNVADFGFGAAGASTITFSFWVKSSLTGTFNIWLHNSGDSRAYVSTYTISAANTWEQKSITVAGDITGTWLKTNGAGLLVGWSLGCGSSFDTTANTWTSSDYKSTSGATSVVGTNGATFYLTGVQLEVGSKATTFEHRSYGDELARCQRYVYELTTFSGNNGYPNVSLSSGTMIGVVEFPVTMRSAPSLESGTTIEMNIDTWSATGGTTRNFRPFTSKNSLYFGYYSTDNSSTNLAVGYFGIRKTAEFSAIFSAEL